MLPYERARWLEGDPGVVKEIRATPGSVRVEDREGRPVMLLRDDWALRYIEEKNPNVRFLPMVSRAVS